MANTFVFERRVIYWENTWVDADDINEAREKLRNGEEEQCQLEGLKITMMTIIRLWNH